ncbi:response regulator transcription factor [Massilia sp. TS11]|uniref:response regulator transcription factor n=1 Tax=Massilia sp. TS11 TaxID=2908003 RepID=UPI001EDB5604|nr:response regulator transcription factor [Massilia sp. TS11]MCG2586851.1 response regulator transcription factor [Massilia sp. TS11]
MPSSAAHRLHIVLVEDHDLLREVLREALAAHGHTVVALSSAEAVDDEIGTAPVDLMVLDINLPGEDGFSLAARYRAAHPHGGLVLVSGRVSLGDKLAGYAAGADLYMTKPIEPLELGAAVAALARRIAAGRQLPPEPGAPLHLHMRTLLLQAAGKEVKLSHGEAALLSALARAPGQRLEAWQLLELLGDNAGSKGALEVRLTRLRAKLRQIGAPDDVLRSLRNHGYQLCTPVQID